MAKRKTKKSRKSKKVSKSKKAKVAKKKSKIGRNKFGTMLRTKAAKIDAALSEKPQTMAQLIKRANVKGTFSNHMRVMVNRGFVTKTKKGYALKK